jgi:hypothetical protein
MCSFPDGGKGKGWVPEVGGEGVEAIEKVRISKYDQYVSTTPL